jgi:CRISPR-associated protein Cas5d
MAYGVKLLVWGDYASFNRPEMKVERVTYDVITPSAARGVLEAIYWKPEMRWIIDRLHVLEPIRFTQVRRNEIKGVIPVKGALSAAMKGQPVELGLDVAENRQQRAATLLRNVRYGIEAHVEVLRHEGPEQKPEAKHLDQFNRRAARGQFFHHPYLGTREFPAHFELVSDFPRCSAELSGERRLGLMLHDVEFVPDADGTIIESHEGTRLRVVPRVFEAVMRDGIIDVPPLSRESRP